MNGRDDTELIARVKEGDFSARDRLVVRWLPLISAVVARMRLPPGAHEDMAQEAALGVLRRIHRFDPARGDLRAWLSSAVVQSVHDYLRGNGISVVRVNRARARQLKREGISVRSLVVSLDEPLRGGEGKSHGEVLEDRGERFTEVLERKDLARAALDRLDGRTAKLLRMLFPLDGASPPPQHEVGRRLGISESRVRQLKSECLETLRRAYRPPAEGSTE